MAGRLGLEFARAMMKAPKCHLRIAAEGASIDIWKKQFPVDIEGTHEFCPLSENQMESVCSNANVIVTGLSIPINWEAQASVAANQKGVPLVWLEDVWGGHMRSPGSPQLLLACDDLARRMIMRSHRKARVITVGNSAVRRARRNPPSHEIMQRFKTATREYDRTVFISGQGAQTPEIIDMALASVLLTPGKTGVMWSMHPKHRGSAHDHLSQMIIRKWAREHRDVIMPMPTISADHIAALSDITFSGSSNILLVSASSGKLAISVNGPMVREYTMKEMGVHLFPPASDECGAVIRLSSPRNLATLPFPKRAKQYVEEWAIKFPADEVIAAIRTLC